jgi:uncharacterized membrane protein
MISLLVSLAIVAPFFWLANPSGHDIAFHASSWFDVVGQWKEGILFPRWCEWANYGYGEPRFIFYPPLSWLLGGALGEILPWSIVAGAFIVLVQSLAGVSAYVLARRFVSHRHALLGAACYVANPYAVLVIYVRSDYAELLAMAFFPLLLVSCLQLCGRPAEMGLRNAQNRDTGRPFVHFALAFAAIWLSNAPAGVIASYAVALLFALAALTQKSWLPLTRGAGGLALGFGLSAFYLIPAAYEERWVNIGQLLTGGFAPADNFLFTRINDPDHNAFNRVASALAVLMMFLTFLAILGAWRQLKANASDFAASFSAKSWHAFFPLAVVSSLLMLRFTLPLWTWLPELRFVQFPWRWMSLLAPIFSVFFAAAIIGRRRAWAWATLLLLLLGGTAVFLGRNTWWDQDDFPSVQEAIAQEQGFEGTDEYDPVGDDHTNLPQNQPQARMLPPNQDTIAPTQSSFRIERWTAEDRRISVSADRPVRLAVRLLDYPAWRVTVNGRSEVPQHEQDFSAMEIPLGSGTSHVEIRFTRTRDRTLGSCTSVFALLAAAFLAVYPGKK